MNQTILHELEAALRQERARLVGELSAIAKPDPRAPGRWDTRFPKFEAVETGSHAAEDEEADEVEEYEVRLAEEGSLETRLLAVTRALERIAKGGYGLCVSCKKPIPLQRLRANPAAEYDISHTP
ncbi:MAG: TraR/DksA C4-type zinc finger protein [Candidatus Sungbacteria bacterium]|uniref:TraR/DksA C4-type zinc finger protein n=1 Tax=Candidatus Sungiibacteriota bacterium TaxID=2750080 RepID=A0A932QYK6_9BACT|nr:TraR/DksA C4-type zinc finger protein [Candidatus Sungbacteria bacterium]